MGVLREFLDQPDLARDGQMAQEKRSWLREPRFQIVFCPELESAFLLTANSWPILSMFWIRMTPGSLVRKTALLDLSSSAPPRLVKQDPRTSRAGLQFTPDGKSLAYVIRENGVDNLWIQPLDSSPGRKITNFNAEEIVAFHWSPDGKTLGILRGHVDSDVVLLQESKP